MSADQQITWAQRVQNLQQKLGRRPALDELLAEAKKHMMTKEKRDDKCQRAATNRSHRGV